MTYDIEAVRARFPSLAVQDNGIVRTYLDNPAGTQVPVDVMNAVRDYFIHSNGNISGHFKTSRATGALYADAHEAMADFVNAADASEIIFGLSMTALTINMTHTLEKTLSPGDEIIVTAMDHDGNVSPWRLLAERRGLTLKTLPFNTETYRYDLSALDALLTDRTKVVAVNYASNLIGTINDVSQISAMARNVGALTYVDAVQFAPHGIVDVQALGCDFLVCSAYKFFGPHQGILWGRKALLEALTPDKIEAAPDDLPNRYEIGTGVYELMAGTLAAVNYYAWVGDMMGEDPLAPSLNRSARQRVINRGKQAMETYERDLVRALIDGLHAIPGVKIYGLTDPADMPDRVPTVSFTMEGRSPSDIAAHLAADNIFVWSGHNYALNAFDQLGLDRATGVVRIGIAHYNTAQEVDRTLESLRTMASLKGMLS